MNNIQKICLSLSCFLPLYFIFLLKNGGVIFHVWLDNKTIDFKSFDFIMAIVWILLLVAGHIGLRSFKRNFLKAQNKAKEMVNIVSAENITSEYFFTYFSLFVLTFFTVEPSCEVDIFVLALVMLLMIRVYMKNEMYFINPMLNLMGYKSFSLECQKAAPEGVLNEGKCFKINVFTEENLLVDSDDLFFITFSPHDFSVCYKKEVL